MGTDGWAQPVARPSPEVGIPFPKKHYPPDAYGQYPQNWGIAQDSRGVIYVANRDGILEYDGTDWAFIPIATQARSRLARSVAVGPTDRVYVGGEGEIGALQPDSIGRLKYASLLDHVPEADRGFQDVWATHATDAAVFFQSWSRLFRWQDSTMTVWQSKNRFHTSFSVRNRLFVRDREVGLMEVVGDSLQLVPRGEVFADVWIYLMTPYPDGRILIGTKERGMLLYDGWDLEPFSTEADAYFEEHTPYHGGALPGGHTAVGTLGGGVVVLNADGQVVQSLTPDNQLPDGVVNHVFAGSQGELWLAFNNNGLMRSDVLSSLSRFDESLGLEGTIRDIERYDGRLYVATGVGVYVLQTRSLEDAEITGTVTAQFEQLPDVPIAFELTNTQYGLLAATQMGIYRLTPTGGEQLAPNTSVSIVASRAYQDRLYVGNSSGVEIMEPVERGVPLRMLYDSGNVRDLAEAPDGTVWASLTGGSLLRILPPTERDGLPAVQTYTAADGLPDGRVGILTVNGTLYMVTTEQIYRVDPVPNSDRVQIVPDDRLMPGAPDDGALRSLAQNRAGWMWAIRGDRFFQAPDPGAGPVEWTPIDNLHFPKSGISTIKPEDDGVMWISDGNTLMRFNSAVVRPVSNSFQALVRRVSALKDGRTIYGGSPPDDVTEADPFAIPYAVNDLRFHVAAPLFNVATPNRYQFRLEGEDADWSQWTAQSSVAYTDLVEGTYRFQVRARNERGVVGTPGGFTFRVLPPWYRTVWAYGVYALGIVLLGLSVRRYYLVVQENERQRERTQQLEREREANERLQRANHRLRQANELKENFLASTSHELRTPLTNILGFTDLIREETTQDVHSHLDVVEHNGRRLLRTLNALLDLASLRAGEMNPSFGRVNITATVHGIAREYSNRAKAKGIDLCVDVPGAPAYALLDERYLEQVLRNLIDNAIKFTQDGTVTIVLTADPGSITIAVEDTGIGINEAFMPDLFRDFKQESDGLARTYEGSGLGLAISARLIELMNGAITVQSEKGAGSTFTVTFPRRQ